MSDGPTRVSCTECPFARIVYPDDDELPADVIIEHGRETGHRLTLSDQDEERDPLRP